MFKNKYKIFILGLVFTVLLVLANANQSFSSGFDDFSPIDMIRSASQMNQLFNNLSRDQDCQRQMLKKSSYRPKEKLIEMQLRLFELQSYLAGFQQRIMQKKLSEEIFELAFDKIHEKTEDVERLFVAFCRSFIKGIFHEQYKNDIDLIYSKLKDTTSSSKFKYELGSKASSGKPIDEYGYLIGNVIREISILDMSIVNLKNQFEQR